MGGREKEKEKKDRCGTYMHTSTIDLSSRIWIKTHFNHYSAEKLF